MTIIVIALSAAVSALFTLEVTGLAFALPINHRRQVEVEKFTNTVKSVIKQSEE